MGKKIAFALVLIILPSISALYAQPESIILKYIAKQRPAVAFNHGFHMSDFACLDCHHDYDKNKKNILQESDITEGNEAILCSSCHDGNTSLNLQEAFHKQCIGCHISYKAKSNKPGQTTGPRFCGGCHKSSEAKEPKQETKQEKKESK